MLLQFTVMNGHTVFVESTRITHVEQTTDKIIINVDKGSQYSGTFYVEKKYDNHVYEIIDRINTANRNDLPAKSKIKDRFEEILDE